MNNYFYSLGRQNLATWDTKKVFVEYNPIFLSKNSSIINPEQF